MPLLSAALLFLPALSLPAQQLHATFQIGDIIAGGQTPSVITAFGRFDWFLPNGPLNRRMAETLDEFPGSIAFDRSGNLYIYTFGVIRVFDSSGRYVRDFPRFRPSTSSGGGILFDAEGNAYTPPPANIVSPANLAKTTPAGDLITTFLLPIESPVGITAGIGGIDLGSDQCTMYYTSLGTRVLRYDVCRRTALPDLTSSLPGRLAGEVRILPDGGVLVANFETIVRVNGSGTIVQTYDVPGANEWERVALNPDGQSFWATWQNTAYKFDLATGTVIGSFQSSDYLFTALGVVGEPRVAVPPQPQVAIPTLSEWMLLVLLLSLGALALLRLNG